MNDLLPEFQKFLQEHKLSPEKNVRFLAYWVSRFLRFVGKKGISQTDYQEAAAMEFLERLHMDNRTTQQISEGGKRVGLAGSPASQSTPPCIRCATALPPICFRQA